MVNWSDPDIEAWKKEARKKHQDFFSRPDDREWVLKEGGDWITFRRKVGFNLFGPPKEEPTKVNLETGYNKKQLQLIQRICEQLVVDLNLKSQNVQFACVLIVAKYYTEDLIQPVFKAKEENSPKLKFVDSSGRIYQTWSEYLKNNVLPKCLYCYPVEGIYSSDENGLTLRFDTSPACSFSSKVESVLDKTATAATIGAAGIGVAALFGVPVGRLAGLAAIVGVPIGVYSVTRNSLALCDRKRHGQSIDLSDSDASKHWISIAGSALGFAHGRMLTHITQATRAGEVMGNTGRIAFRIAQAGSLTLNGWDILQGFSVLIDKYENRQLSSIEMFQWSSSALFFTNSAINAKSASTLIKEVQNDMITNHKNGLSVDELKQFRKFKRRVHGVDKEHKNAKIVQRLNRTENSQQF